MALSDPIRGRSFQRRVSVGGPLWTFGGFLRGLGGASAAMGALRVLRGVGVLEFWLHGLQVFVTSYARNGFPLQAQYIYRHSCGPGAAECFLVSYIH